LKRITLAGFILGLAGAFLDFSSGYLILTQSKMSVDTMGVMMTEYNSTSLAWGIGLAALGALLIATSFASVSSLGIARMRIFGVLMMVYGAIMLLIGETMYSGMAPIMEGSFLSSVGMLLVGTLMLLNGFLMSRTGNSMMLR
jgi:hypothetical protein